MNATTTRRYDPMFANGTSKVGQLKADYATLLGAFGYPDLFPQDYFDGKIQTRWCFSTVYGPMTIYAYKPEQPKEQITEWSVGGKDLRVVDIAMSIIREETAMCAGCGRHATRCSMTEVC